MNYTHSPPVTSTYPLQQPPQAICTAHGFCGCASPQVPCQHPSWVHLSSSKHLRQAAHALNSLHRHSPAAHHCKQGSNPKWQIQDPATGQLEPGKLDKAVVHGLEGRQGYVGWDISSSLKHRWEQPPFSEVSPQEKEVNTTPWGCVYLGLPGPLPGTSTHPCLQCSQTQREGGCLLCLTTPTHTDQPQNQFPIGVMHCWAIQNKAHTASQPLMLTSLKPLRSAQCTICSLGKATTRTQFPTPSTTLRPYTHFLVHNLHKSWQICTPQPC